MIRRRAVVIANEIRLRRSQHSGSFLVVEGRDDRLLCERFIDAHACKIVVADGKENVCEVVRILDEDEFVGHLGIVDSDFDVIEQRSFAGPNLAVTSAHDVETILLQSSALDALLIEYGSSEKLQQLGAPVRTLLRSTTSAIGSLRLYSQRKALNLRFDGISYGDFVSQDTLALEREGLIREVKNKSQRHDLVDQALHDGLTAIEGAGYDALHLCSGSDLIGVLSLGLRRLLGSNNAGDVDEEHVRRSLRLAYPEQEFLASDLRARVAAWEAANQGFRILR